MTTEYGSEKKQGDANSQAAAVRMLLSEIAEARKREKDWRKDGRRILEIYGGKKKEQIPFNILYSNTETLLPALYNSQPRPVVQRRFKDEDALGKAAAQAGVRTLEFLVDTNSEEHTSFDDVMGDAVVDGLLPGRGASRVRYDATITEDKPPVVTGELVVFESLKWDRWIFGFAKKWKRVPWIAFEHDIDKDEATRLFGAAVANKIQFTEPNPDADDKEDGSPKPDEAKTGEERKLAKVFEVWKKKDRTVCFVSPHYQDGYLKEEEDPLELTGFFPVPEPLRFLRKSNDLQPTPPYALYENQAKELNRLTTRLNKVIEALKVRGAYDSTITELGQLLKADDGAMVSAENVAALQDGGLEKAIWLMPLEKLVVVAQQLYIARNNCKQVIYEITGISDILRGSTVASETATAQEIKAQWGTLRLKRMQREVQRYARDMLRLALEVAAKKFQERTFAGMTGLPYATSLEAQIAGGQVAAARGAMPPQPPPREAVETLQKPVWAKVMELLRSDTQRMYRIDIETNSTIDLEATEDQKIMGEVLQAVSTFIQGVTPLIVSGSMPFEVAQSMLLAIVRRYRFGPEIEDYIKAMQPPKSPDEGKQKMEREKHQLEMQGKQQELDMKKEIAAMELEVKREELKLKKVEIQLKHAAAVQKLQLEQVQGQQDLALDAAQKRQDLEFQRQGGDLKQQQAKQQGDEKFRQQRQQGELKNKQAAQAQKNKPNGGKDARS